MHKICLIEDEITLMEFIKLNLELEGFEVWPFSNGKEAFDVAESISKVDLVVLDNMLPGKNGLEVCAEIRSMSLVPILFISAKGTTQERIEGLKAGANDYLPKPFDLEEFLLKVRVLLPATQNGLVKIGQIEVNFSSLEAIDAEGKSIHSFSKREIALLDLFLKNPNRVISRDEILDKIWGQDAFPTSRTIDNFILTFRKLFEENPKKPSFFHSIRGIGYKFTIN